MANWLILDQNQIATEKRDLTTYTYYLHGNFQKKSWKIKKKSHITKAKKNLKHKKTTQKNHLFDYYSKAEIIIKNSLCLNYI